MTETPTGTVTFLFTDIEGSTRLWEQHPEAMGAALARHDALLGAAIAAHRGYVFKTVGDAFCAAFGPDFRRAFVDRDPTANVDVGPTITHLLGLLPNIGSGGLHPTGREMTEALRGERSFVGTPRPFTMTTKLTLQGVDVTTTLKLTRLGDRQYLDDSNVVRNPLGSSP